ncbi:F-box only protein 40-like isoform X1 [Hippoglossus hippoglossus]|uniref:F-box only protein 40-like isoform X1 n=1 Tax=Hippoglossus hippoglossus TaxID=8267 RepID=UPI00148D0882|nr:F-box only protein 40-like isoform X1 [Hippoglossus hippoglossus]
MSRRSRASRERQHVHCDSCYSRRCRARVEVSVCCALIPCRLHCGALFHLCKEEDHLLLCPNVRVPCLNAGYGCPVQLPRSSQAAHLQVCPASVVCCSMEWLRWPTDDTNPHSYITLQENVLKDDEGQGEALDVAVALADQAELYSRLKMRPLYPEQMEEEEEEEIREEKKEEMAMAEFVTGVTNSDANKAENSSVQNSAGLVLSKEKHNLCDMMFSMERGGCAVAQENLGNPEQSPRPAERGQAQSAGDLKEAETQDSGVMGLAPWHEGVMERLGKQLTPQEYSMYIVHHGRMLLNFGQIHACTPRELDFVYGSLEPIPVQTLRSFKVPESYHYRSRVHMYETVARAPCEQRGVDTSDLGVNEEDWFSDEAAATLLGYTEGEVMGHKISESKAIDCLYIDVGTQTHSFRSAPFKRRTTLAEVMVDRPLRLRLQLQAESVNSRHSRASCVFAFLCGHTFHRREFAAHVRNVHSDILTCLSGWFEQRCPLAYLGCTYSQGRFEPSTQKATVTFNQQLRSFNLRPTLVDRGGGEASLSSLPYEVLCHVTSFLDSLSLSQLALVSRLMRQVCSSLLQDRGMVTLRWERTPDSHGGARWRAKPVWEFSRLFSSVDSWHMSDIPPMSAHLKVCPHYETCVHSEPVPLPSMSDKQRCSQEERMSLVNLFTGNRW